MRAYMQASAPAAGDEGELSGDEGELYAAYVQASARKVLLTMLRSNGFMACVAYLCVIKLSYFTANLVQIWANAI